MQWEPEEPAWQYVLLDALSPSIDATIIAENLKLSPTERLEALIAMVVLEEEIRRARGNPVSRTP